MADGSMCLWIIKRPSSIISEHIVNSKEIQEVLEFNGFVDAKNSTNAQFNFRSNIFKAVYGRDATSGEKGCAMAHLRAYQAFLQSAHKFMLVVEDDVLVADAARMEQNLQKASLLGSNFVVGLETRRPNLRRQNHGLEGGSRLPFFGTAMYLLDRAAAQKALESLIQGKDFYWQADFPPKMGLSTKFFLANDWSVTSTSNNSGIMRPAPESGMSLARFIGRVIKTITLTELSLMDRFSIMYAVHYRELQLATRK